ncbi:hypothetical protein K438DRAFT_564142 [Mycena galopus ATCC 62051]|nr:hypothetical protein K438DRAFT_564142 [Mycena galopus ATCC 62051]
MNAPSASPSLCCSFEFSLPAAAVAEGPLYSLLGLRKCPYLFFPFSQRTISRSKGAMEAEAAAKEAGVAGEAGTEITVATKIMGRVSKFLKVIGPIGFIMTVVGVAETIQGVVCSMS